MWNQIIIFNYFFQRCMNSVKYAEINVIKVTNSWTALLRNWLLIMITFKTQTVNLVALRFVLYFIFFLNYNTFFYLCVTLGLLPLVIFGEKYVIFYIILIYLFLLVRKYFELVNTRYCYLITRFAILLCVLGRL